MAPKVAAIEGDFAISLIEAGRKTGYLATVRRAIDCVLGDKVNHSTSNNHLFSNLINIVVTGSF